LRSTTAKKNTALYRHFCQEGSLLYIGISLSALTRLGQHEEHSAWFDKIRTVTIENFQNREAAKAAEKAAIINEKPFYNVHYKKMSPAPQIEPTFADDTRADLVAKILRVSANYTVIDVAQTLQIRPMDVRMAIDRGELGYWELQPDKPFTHHGNPTKPKVFVTGFQLIEYLENLGRGDR
jgi:predicted GIY-YIG superfamily endonuclease